MDASGIDAADAALGLAKFYYVTGVLVSPTVYASLFAVPKTKAADFGEKRGPSNLADINVNPDENAPDNILIGILNEETPITTVLLELNSAGFNVQQRGNDRVIIADVRGKDAADLAIGLKKHYYVIEVLMSKRIYSILFTPPN